MIQMKSSIKALAFFFVCTLCFASCSKDEVQEIEPVKTETQDIDMPEIKMIVKLPEGAEKWTEKEIMNFINENKDQNEVASLRNNNSTTYSYCIWLAYQAAVINQTTCPMARFFLDHGILLITSCLWSEMIQLGGGYDCWPLIGHAIGVSN